MAELHPIDNTETLGELIRATRTVSGLTQADAAALCGVSVPFLVDLERGKSTARVGSILQVLQGLGMKLLIAPPVTVSATSPKRKPRTRPAHG